ncbi:MAG: pyridoxal phosphate-dependent aminotransferase, partial [Planctomycetes bacterium]|nr:pyridoxal phosphate-dependent aminotransferase [Planctomycetota bacterium]
MRFAARQGRLGTETAFEVLAAARRLEAAGRDVVHLEIGEPDFPTPRNIVEAAQEALEQGWTHYGPSAGLPELRSAVAEEVSRTRDIPVDPDEVVITPGGKPILFFTLSALVEEGEEVIYPDPGFPIYESMVRYLGGRPVPIPLEEASGFRLDLDRLRTLLTPRTRLVILNSPQNPTGGVLSPEDLRAIAALLEGTETVVLSDEIYSRVLYEGVHRSIAACPGMKGRTIILDGFSKTYAMTGWRLGYGVMRADLAEQIARLQTNSNSCTASFVQRAGLAALQGPQDGATRMVAEFRRRRDTIVGGLNSLPGFSCRNPKGAFYVFPNIRGTGLTSKELADSLLDRAGVAALSGTC